MKTWGEKLKHPKWQEKRLRIMRAANFECVNCGDRESTLYVHHTRYIKGRDPWDYEDGLLVCLCESCHSETHHLMDEILVSLGRITAYGPGDLYEVLGFLDAMSLTKDSLEIDFERRSWIGTYEYYDAIAKYFGIEEDPRLVGELDPLNESALIAIAELHPRIQRKKRTRG